MTSPSRAARSRFQGDFVAAQRHLEALGWTDGLPVIPPTEELVAEMIAGVGYSPDTLLGEMEPLKGSVTIEKLAANAVMAGCAPEYFGIVVAAAKAVVDFAKTNDKFVVLGGALGTQTLNAEGVKALAELPSLETLRAQLVGLIQTPATRIAGVLQAPGGQVARVLAAYAKKDEAQAA